MIGTFLSDFLETTTNHLPDNIESFTNTFVAFYRARHKRRNDYDSHYLACDNSTLINLFDRPDQSDITYRECVMQRIDDIIDEFRKNPPESIHNTERACEILQLYRDGLTFRQIAHLLGIDVAAVHRYLTRFIASIKSQQEMATI